MARVMPPMTAQMEGALQFLAARGEMTVRQSNAFIHDEVSARTAYALERRGLCERIWSDPKYAGKVVITSKGRELADSLLPLDEDTEVDDVYEAMERRAARRAAATPST